MLPIMISMDDLIELFTAKVELKFMVSLSILRCMDEFIALFTEKVGLKLMVFFANCETFG